MEKAQEKEPKPSTEIRSVSELREFFRTLIESHIIPPCISRADIRQMTIALQEMHPARPIVQELMDKFSLRIKRLTQKEQAFGKKTKEALMAEFVTIEAHRQEWQPAEGIAEKIAEAAAEADQILQELGPDIDVVKDPALIGIPPGAKSRATLTARSPRPEQKFTRLSPRKNYPEDQW